MSRITSPVRGAVGVHTCPAKPTAWRDSAMALLWACGNAVGQTHSYNHARQYSPQNPVFPK